MSAVPAYLSRLGIEAPPPPTSDMLFLLHHRHLEQVPYENLGIVLGRPPSVDAIASLERIGEVGRAGYCFHHNDEDQLRALHPGMWDAHLAYRASSGRS
jgi:N-hydroxyarylamine O-acetyltransferase